MTRLALVGITVLALVALIGVAYAQKAPEPAAGRQAASNQKPPEEVGDTLEGTLRIHSKFHYRYYIDGFGAGQACALFRADDRLAKIEPGTLIRVRGDLASRFFGGAPNGRRAALVSTWIIYMNVDEVEVLRRKDDPARRFPTP